MYHMNSRNYSPNDLRKCISKIYILHHIGLVDCNRGFPRRDFIISINPANNTNWSNLQVTDKKFDWKSNTNGQNNFLRSYQYTLED